MRVIDNTCSFGVYILTYPGDFHLSTVLVHSIRHVSPDVPIMIIPGEGFDRDDHSFDVPVMPMPGGFFWPEIGHQDRKFWSFQGPFETFLYLDADTICTRPLDPLIERIMRQQGDFIYVQPWIDDREWRSVIQDPSHRDHAKYAQHVSMTIGRGPLARFDPDHDWSARYPFNSGVFASRRLAIQEGDLASLNQAEQKFYSDVLGAEKWTWKCSALFFRDQGRLNYLARKLSIPMYPLHPDLICRSGASAKEVSVAEVESGTCDYHIIHWMGAKSPSPSLFCRGPLFRIYAYLWSFVGRRTGRWIAPGYERLPECVGYSLWRHHHDRSYGPPSLRARVHWSWPDLLRACRLLRRFVKIAAGAVRRRCATTRLVPFLHPWRLRSERRTVGPKEPPVHAAMIRSGIPWAASAAFAGFIFGAGVGTRYACGGSLDYVGVQLDIARPGNTHNNDNHEASSEWMLSGQGFVGWDLAPWAAVQVNLAGMRQYLHGYNHGSVRESDDGDRYAIAAMVCPVLRVPGLILTPYVSGCVGPAYERIDGGPSSVTGTHTDEHNLELALRGAFGVERRIYGPWSIRLEGAYMRVGAVDAMDQLGASAALVYSFQGHR